MAGSLPLGDPEGHPMRAIRCGVAVAAVAGFLFGPGVFAAHAAELPELTLFTPSRIYLEPGEQKSGFTRVAAPGLASLTDFTVTVTIGELKDIASLDDKVAGLSCQTADGVLTCGGPGTELKLTDGQADLDLLDLTGDQAAAPGAEAALTVSVTASNAHSGPAATRQVKVIVAEAGDLVAGAEQIDLSGDFGTVVTTPVSFRNAGQTTVEGVVLAYSTAWESLTVATRFGNCLTGDKLVVCHFDTAVAPGTAYRLSAPVGFRIDPHTRAPGHADAAYLWLTELDFAEHLENGSFPGYDDLKPGDGPAVHLEALSAAGSMPDYDPNLSDNGGSIVVTVTGSNPLDLVPLGQDVSGAKGETVKLPVGIRNASNAVMSDDSLPFIRLTLPNGVSATKTPEGCRPPAGRDQREYRCRVREPIPPGESLTWTFPVRFDEQVSDAEGLVEIPLLREPEGSLPFDDVLDNNKLVIRFNPAASPSPSSSGTTPGMPTTGAPLARIVGAGLLALLTGYGLYVFARRRSGLQT